MRDDAEVFDTKKKNIYINEKKEFYLNNIELRLLSLRVPFKQLR